MLVILIGSLGGSTGNGQKQKNFDTSFPKKRHHKKVTFYWAWCKSCGYCSVFCPKKAICLDSKGHPYLADSDACVECGLCQALCPDFAIYVPAFERKHQAAISQKQTG